MCSQVEAGKQNPSVEISQFLRTVKLPRADGPAIPVNEQMPPQADELTCMDSGSPSFEQLDTPVCGLE